MDAAALPCSAGRRSGTRRSVGEAGHGTSEWVTNIDSGTPTVTALAFAIRAALANTALANQNRTTIVVEQIFFVLGKRSEYKCGRL